MWKTAEEKAAYEAMAPDAPDTEQSLEGDAELMAGYWIPLPTALLRSGLSNEAKLLWAHLAALLGEKAFAFPGRQWLIAQLRCGNVVYDRAMRELTDSGLVEVRRRGLGKTNLYYVRTWANSQKLLNDNIRSLPNDNDPLLYRESIIHNPPPPAGEHGRDATHPPPTTTPPQPPLPGISETPTVTQDRIHGLPQARARVREAEGVAVAEKDMVAVGILAAYRKAKYGPKAEPFTNSEWNGYKVALRSMAKDKITEAEAEAATRLLLGKFSDRDMVNPNSLMRYISGLRGKAKVTPFGVAQKEYEGI